MLDLALTMCWLQVTDQTPKELFRVICAKCNGPGGQGEADLYEYKRMMALRYPEQYYFTNDQEEREAVAQAFLPKFLEQQEKWCDEVDKARSLATERLEAALATEQA